jgi:hypothetical protein
MSFGADPEVKAERKILKRDIQALIELLTARPRPCTI